MLWFVVGMVVVLAGGAAVLFLVLHLTTDHAAPAPFAGTDGTPLGTTGEHAGQQADSAAAAEDDDAHVPPDAPGSPSPDVLPVGRYQAETSDA